MSGFSVFPQLKVAAGRQRLLIRCALVLILAVQVFNSGAQEPRPLTSAKGIFDLPRERANRRLPAEVRGVITFLDLEMMVMFVQDQTGGIFVNAGVLLPDGAVGDEVMVRGFTEAGRYNPIISSLKIDVLGKGALPAAKPVTFDELWSGKFDCQRVTVRGHVRGCSMRGELTVLTLALGDRRVEVWAKGLPRAELDRLDFAEVELTGPTSVGESSGRVPKEIALWVPGVDHFRVLRNGAEVMAATPLVTTAGLAGAAMPPADEVVRVRGTVIHASERVGIVIQDGPARTVATTFGRDLPGTGAAVEAVGWLRPERMGRSRIVGAHLKVLGLGAPIVPAKVSLGQIQRSRTLEGVVEVDGALRHRIESKGESTWIVEAEDEYLEVLLPAGSESLSNPIAAAGTTVRLTGFLHREPDPLSASDIVRLLVRSPADIEIISEPPWPAARVLRVLTVTLVLHVVGVVALMIMYRRLRRRTTDLSAARGALERANSELENRVEARTVTLKSANEALANSEERFRQLTTHIDEIFWMGTADNSELLYLSPSFEKICGRPVADIYAKPSEWFQLVHPEDRDQVFAVAFKQPVTVGYEIEYRVVRPDGSIRWLNDRAFPIRDSAGRVFRVAGIAADITARKLAEEELHEQNIALSHAMPGIARLTVDGCYVSANVHYARLQGCEPKGLVGTHYSKTVHPEDMLVAMQTYERMVATGQGEMEIRGVRIDGGLYWKQAVLVRSTKADGTMTGFHCFIRDISARKQDELLLEGQKAVLETIADGAPLKETLDTLARFIEAQASGVRVSILLVTADGKHLTNGAAPSVPEVLHPLTACLPIGPEVGSCGSCAFHRQRVVVADLATNPLFDAVKEPFLAQGIRAAVSAPVLDGAGQLLGTFCLFFDAPLVAEYSDDRLLPLGTQLAAIAIERERTRAAERLAEERYRSIVDTATDAVITFSEEGGIEIFNRSAEILFGYTATAVAGRKFEALLAEEYHPQFRQHLNLLSAGSLRLGRNIPLSGRRVEGDGFPMEASLSQSVVEGRTIITVIIRDLTEKTRNETTRAQLEARLRQAQKMEAIGTLAGGIAHDFNNILGAVMLNIELARGEVPPEHPAQEYLAALRGSSLRARDLVRQILAFSRQQEQQRQLLRLERAVEEAIKLVRAALPATIEINLHLASDGPAILADATQVHQVLTNLSANAGHAMRHSGGRLDIHQQTIDVDARMAATSPDLQVGRYVELIVSDTGEGISAGLIDRIFDPFFTTKGPGEGTGLGLAVVHGIMKDHDGAVLVESTPGKGTVFRLYVPAVEQGEEVPAAVAPVPIPRGSGERVLIVDDESALLRVNQRTLERLGYKVTAHTSPAAALDAFRMNPTEFDLVITDLAMPGMTGMEFSRELLRVRPDCPVVLTTGYTTTLDPKNVKSLGLAGLLFKPATAAAIGEMVRDALERERAL